MAAAFWRVPFLAVEQDMKAGEISKNLSNQARSSLELAVARTSELRE